MTRNLLKLNLFNFFLSLTFLSPVIVFFYQSRGLNLGQIFALESILIFFSLLMEIPTGYFADKFGRKIAIIIGGFLFLSEPVIFLFAWGFLPFVIAAALYGIGTAFISGALEAFIYEDTKTKNNLTMLRAMGGYGAAGLLGAAIAPVIGSLIASHPTANAYIFLIYLTITASLIGWMVSFFIKEKGLSQKSLVKGFFIKESLSVIRKNSELKKLIIFEILTNPLLFVAVYLAQPYFLSIGIRVVFFGVIFTLGLLLDALLRRLGHKFVKNLGYKSTFFLALIVPGILYILMAYIFNPLWAVIIFILLRGFSGLRIPLFAQSKNILIPSWNRATILSTIAMLVGIYEVIGIFILGQLANINLALPMKTIGIVVIITSLLFYFIIKNPLKAYRESLA